MRPKRVWAGTDLPIGCGPRGVGPSGPFFVGQVAGRQAASLADGDSAAMTVSAETGIENMGKS
jgi:hypothetical protein